MGGSDDNSLSHKQNFDLDKSEMSSAWILELLSKRFCQGFCFADDSQKRYNPEFLKSEYTKSAIPVDLFFCILEWKHLGPLPMSHNRFQLLVRSEFSVPDR